MPSGSSNELKFSHNYNGKLKCDYFTTIRLHNEKKFRPGNKLQVCWSGQWCDDVEVMDRKVFFLKDLNAFMAFLDTGCSVEETKKMIHTMYSNYKVNVGQAKFDFVLCKWLKESKYNLQNSTLFQ